MPEGMAELRPTSINSMDIPKALRQSGLKATLPSLRILQLFHERGIGRLPAEDIYRFLIEILIV
jgi:Fe2+ or Zn2+ uptake regulation protein